MAKYADDAFIEDFDSIGLCTTLTVCSAQPANQAGVAAVALVSYTIAPADFTKSDGVTSGRRWTISAQSGNNASASGTANHVVIDDGTSIYVTTTPDKTAVSGEEFNVGAWDIEFADPS